MISDRKEDVIIALREAKVNGRSKYAFNNVVGRVSGITNVRTREIVEFLPNMTLLLEVVDVEKEYQR